MLHMRLSVILFCLAASFPATAQEYDLLPAQHSLQYYRLQGPVLRMLEKQWLPPQDSLYYDQTASFIPDQNYRLESSCEMTFDSSGNVPLIQSREPDERKRKELKEKMQLFYYQGKQLIAYSNKEEDKTDSVAFHYRKNGQIDHYRVFGNKQELLYKMTYVYKNGKLNTQRKNDQGNMPVAMVKYKYKGGQLMETQHFDDQYRLTETQRYSNQLMNDNQRNESRSVTGPDGQMKSGLSLVKDGQGNILEQNTINGNREVTEYRSFIYDKQNQPVTEKIFSALQEATITNRYVYDDKGNWTKKEVFYNGQLRSVYLRALQYR